MYIGEPFVNMIPICQLETKEGTCLLESHLIEKAWGWGPTKLVNNARNDKGGDSIPSTGNQHWLYVVWYDRADGDAQSWNNVLETQSR